MIGADARIAAAFADGLAFDWESIARLEQLPPPGSWSTWLILAGRGFGKTRTGAEWVRAQMCGSTPLGAGRCRHIALVAENAADARDVMVGEGKEAGAASGILQVHPRDFRPTYNPSLRRLTWPNGAIATMYSAEEPDQLRGPQHDGAWCDELAKWALAEEVWDQLQFGLRIGKDPRVVVTTTPRPIKTLKEIIADPSTVVTRGTTADNAANLSPKFLETIVGKYGGTRMGRQELDAEMLEDTPGALWRLADIDAQRISPDAMPAMRRIVVAIDPSVTSSENSDETGIIVAGVGQDGEAYVIKDASETLSPDAWAQRAVVLYHKHKADRVVAEVNNGGDLVETVLRSVDPNVAFKAVHASRGKAIRAEPVAALYEQGRVHHVGAFAQLEDQMAAFTSDFKRSTAGYSPDRVDALVWALTELVVTAGNFGIIDFYRQQSEAITAPATKPQTPVRMRGPAGISTAMGISGKQYVPDADGGFTIDAADAPPLLQLLGWKRVVEEKANG